MNEKTYNLVTNRPKLSTLLHLLRELTPGIDVDSRERIAVYETVTGWYDANYAVEVITEKEEHDPGRSTRS